MVAQDWGGWGKTSAGLYLFFPGSTSSPYGKSIVGQMPLQSVDFHKRKVGTDEVWMYINN